MATTKIEWATKVWNPITGCSKISPGCANCYADRMAKRLAGRCGYPADNPFAVTFHYDKQDEPLKWRKPARIFVCSMGDLFHEDVDDWYRSIIIDIISACPQHIFLILTKRADEMLRFMKWYGIAIAKEDRIPWPLQNLWLGVTAENQEQSDKRIPILLRTPAAVRFVSVEPMLGPVDIARWLRITWQCSGCRGYFTGRLQDICPDCGRKGYWCGSHKFNGRKMPHNPIWPAQSGIGIDWVVCGGESGPGARPMHPDWARSLRDQCQGAGVPFLFKQWGEWLPMFDQPWDTDPDGSDTRIVNMAGGQGYHGDGAMWTKRVGKKAAGRLLDGLEWDEYPEVSHG